MQALLALLLAPASAGVFPYPVVKRTLPNGLDVVVIETPEFKDVLSLNTLVLAGARNEVEPGKTGLAHLFEHILFRHRFGGKDQGYDDAMEALGAHNNAWTWFDVTFYHPLTFASNLLGREGLPGLLRLEADRFARLDFTEKIFKTEAGAVLGEYRRTASDPEFRMSEALSELMFPGHSYGHTTMGTLEDVQDMPNEHGAAVRFYKDWYRPSNCVVVAVGDLRAEEFLAAAEKAYAGWEAGPVPALPPARKVPAGPLSGHVAWDSEVAPVLWVAWRAPAFDPGSKDGAVAQLLPSLLTDPAAPLHRLLRYEKKSASALGLADGKEGVESFDERALVVSAKLFEDRLKEKGRAYFEETAADIVREVEGLKDFSKREKAAETLATYKSRLRWDFLASLDSPASIGSTFAWYYRFGRDPAVLDALLAAVESLTPEDVDAFARRAFTPERRAVLTMAPKEGAP